MKILALTVGTGRTRDDIAEALVFCINRHRPEKAIFLCSQKTYDETMPFVLPPITDVIDAEVHVVSNEDEVGYLYSQYIEILHPYSNEADEFIVDFTSGTKAMSAAMFAAGIALDAKEVSYITGDRDATGRVIESSDVSSIVPAVVIAERELAKARKLFNEMDYSAAWKLAEGILRNLDKCGRLYYLANTIRYLGQAYADWERFEWVKASQQIKQYMKSKFGFEHFVNMELLRGQIEYCDEIATELYGDARLFDLWANASRRFKQARYDDALSRLYRAFEYMVQNCLYNNYKIRTDDIDLEAIKDAQLCEATMKKLETRKTSDGKIKIGLKDSMELLAELGDPLGISLVEQYWKPGWSPAAIYKKTETGPLQTWLNARNRSYLAHGSVPVEKTIVENLWKLYEEMLRFSIEPEKFERYLTVSEFLRL